MDRWNVSNPDDKIACNWEELPVVDWTDSPADLNGLVRFACAITFQKQYTSQRTPCLNLTNQSLHVEVQHGLTLLRVGKFVCGLKSQLGFGDVLNETARYKH